METCGSSYLHLDISLWDLRDLCTSPLPILLAKLISVSISSVENGSGGLLHFLMPFER